jgi:hypothetical protein
MKAIEFLSTGKIIYCSQLREYRLHGPGLKAWSFFAYVNGTYKAPFTAGDTILPDHLEAPSNVGPSRGRPRDTCIQHFLTHPKTSTQLRMIRSPGHNVISNIIGPWIPRNDRPESYDLYCATFLALSKS